MREKIEKKIVAHKEDLNRSVSQRDSLMKNVNSFNVRIAQLEGAIHGLQEILAEESPAANPELKAVPDGEAKAPSAE